MIIVENSIVSDDVAECRFRCDLRQCQGACCVEGDGGAPLLSAEVAELEAVLKAVKPYMTERGKCTVEQQGVAVRDRDGDLGTPLVDGGECAYAVREADGTTLCAIEKAYRAGALDRDFPKPVSCLLYPLRITDYGEFTAVNYHRWSVCRCAVGQGDPLYISLKAPLVRRFGSAWYAELTEQIKQKTENE